MESQRYRVERLGRHHDRDAFSCGEESLDVYLRQRARQDADRNVAAVFVLHDAQAERIVGYYTLSASSVRLVDLPPEMQRQLPRYPHMPAILLGRLAVDRSYHGQGFGAVLLYDALRRSLAVGTEEIAAVAVVVDALHDRARTFYERHGFERLSDNAHQLLLPLRTIARLLAEDGA